MVIENDKKVCDFSYLSETVGGNTNAMDEIMGIFIKQIPEDLNHINSAILEIDYSIIKSITHTMKSSVSIMGISVLEPVLQEMEELAGARKDMLRIQQLNQQLNVICNRAIKEITEEKRSYVKHGKQ